jgi:hypothetical protein
MRIVQAVIKSSKKNGNHEWQVNVEITPLGGWLIGGALLWTAIRNLKRLRRRWWLPLGVGVAVAAVRYTASSRQPKTRVHLEEERNGKSVL